MKIIKVIALAGVLGAAVASTTDAQAFWGWGSPWGNNGYGDGFGDGTFNMSFSGRSSARGTGTGYGAPHYGYGYPYAYAPFALAPMVNEKGEVVAPRYPAPYAPHAMATPEPQAAE